MERHIDFILLSDTEDNVLKEKETRSPRRKARRSPLEHWHIIALYLMVYDFLASNGAYFAALWLRFDCQFSMIPREYLTAWLYFVPVYTVFSLAVFWALRLYRSLWRFASFSELTRVAASTVVTAVFHTLCITLLLRRMPASYYIVGAGIQFLLVLAVRFAYRFVLLERSKNAKLLQKIPARRVMLIGAGSAGEMILRSLHSIPHGRDRICCIIDDNSNKWGRYIDGVPIVGGREHILLNVEKYKIEKIFLAIPSATAAQRRDILEICKER